MDELIKTGVIGLHAWQLLIIELIITGAIEWFRNVKMIPMNPPVMWFCVSFFFINTFNK